MKKFLLKAVRLHPKIAPTMLFLLGFFSSQELFIALGVQSNEVIIKAIHPLAVLYAIALVVFVHKMQKSKE